MTQSSNPASVTITRSNQHIAIVTINRPETRNAINIQITKALEAAVDIIENDEVVRAVILTGAGGIFSSGADLKEVSQGKLASLFTPNSGFAGFVYGRRSKPWIAAVEGLAFAGGCEIALACDMIVAAEDAAFALPEVMRGLLASGGGVFRLPRALPRAIAIEMIVTAQRFPAKRLAALGMINRLAAPGGAIEAALELAREICENAPLAVRESLAIARAAADLDNITLRAMSDSAQERLAKTEDFIEGPIAFVEKRAPVWRGR
jgi:enoyl-CoA hydratase